MRLALTAAALAVLTLVDGSATAADPTTADCLAASDASLKSGNDHRLRAERTQLLVCAAASCPPDIRKECLGRVDEVNAQIPTIVFSAKDPSGSDLSAVRVTMDGEVLAERLEGTALSIDPGEHTFTFETAGQARVTRRLVIVEGQKERREPVAFGAAAAAPGALAPTPAPPVDPGGLGTQKILALVAGGVGVIGLGVGTAFGLVALSKKNSAQSECPGACATPDGVSKWNDAATAGNVSTVAFIVGGAGVAGGALLWSTAPGPSASAGAQVGLGFDGVRVRGTW